KAYLSSCLFLKLYCQFKKLFCQHRIILVGHSIAGQESMDTKLLCSLCFQNTESLKKLLLSHSVLGISRSVHDVIADLKDSTWIKTAADSLWNSSDGFFQKRNMGNVVQVDRRSHLIGIPKFFCRGIVGRKHNVFSCAAYGFGQHQFCIRGAVTTKSILPKNLDQERIGRCFNSKVFFKTFIPGKSLLHSPGIFSYAFFIVKVKGRRKLFYNFI